MKKLLLIGTIAVLIIALGGYITFKYFLGSIVRAGVNRFGPNITQTRVELQGAQISPFSGDGTLTGLSVGNPTGWSNANAFRLGKIHLNIEPRSITGDHVVINELVIEQPQFLYETKLVSSNITDLLKNIERSVGHPESDAKTKTGQPIKMVVKKLVLKDGQVTVNVAGAAALNIPLPAIDMADIGVAEGGVTPAQVAAAVMRNVTTQVVAAATDAISKGGLTGANGTIDAAKQAADAIKGLFGGKKKP